MDLTSHSTTAMNFTENQHGNFVLECLYEQVNNSKFCDVILHVQSHKYSAHRCVLASCSPYFENIFREHSTEKENVSINSQNLTIFESVFNYIYTGSIVIDLDIVAEVLRLANYFVLNKLKGYCNEYLERSLHVSNVYLIKDIAEKWGLLTLAKTAHGFILANLLEVIEQDEILNFDEYKIDHLINNKSFPLTEELRVHIICRWVCTDILQRHKIFQRLMGHIQWNKLNVQTLYNMVQGEKLFSESEWCMSHILKLLEDRGLLLHVYTESLRYLERKIQQGQNIEQQLLDKEKEEEENKQKSAILKLDHHEVETNTIADTNSVQVSETGTGMCSVLDKQAEEEMSTIIGSSNEVDIPVDSEFPQTINDEILLADGTKQEEKSLAELTAISQVSLPSEIVHNNEIDFVDPVKPIPVSVLLDVSAASTVTVNTCLEMTDDDIASTTTSISEVKTAAIQGNVEREKHKRKGRPVKLRISKSRLKLPAMLLEISKKKTREQQKEVKKLVKKEKKKRGRPLKKNSKDKKTAPFAVRVRSPVAVKLEEHSELLIDTSFEEDDDNDEDIPIDDSDLDETYSPVKLEDNVIVHMKAEKVRNKKICRRKKSINDDNSSKDLELCCEHCQFKAPDENALMKHINKAHQENMSYCCSKCGYESKWNRLYYKHMKTHFKGPPFNCDYEGCDHVSERIQPLLYHRMRHTDERPFTCVACHMKFRTKNNLATHMRCHTGEKPWECDVCQRSFATKGTLEQHSVTHSEIRPYLCDTCGFSTKYQSHLIAHKRIHTGDVFRCQYPNCKYYTPKRSQLACHMRSHMSIRQHICAICSRAFVEKSHLVRHERIHLDERPFKCIKCDYGSTRRDKLKEHVLKYHSENSPPKNQYKPRKSRRQTFDPAAFPEYSNELSTRVESEYQTQIEKAVEQRNQVHTEIEKARKSNKEWKAIDDGEQQEEQQQETSLPAATNHTQLRNILCQDPQQIRITDNSVLQTQATNNTINPLQVLTAASLGYGDNNTTTIPMVIDPNNSGNYPQLAFALDSRNIGFVQPAVCQGSVQQTTILQQSNTVQLTSDGCVVTSHQPLPQQTNPVNNTASTTNSVAYNTTNLVQVSVSQPQQTQQQQILQQQQTSTEFSQLHNIVGGLLGQTSYM